MIFANKKRQIEIDGEEENIYSNKKLMAANQDFSLSYEFERNMMRKAEKLENPGEFYEKKLKFSNKKY